MANHNERMVVVDDEVYTEGYREPMIIGKCDAPPPYVLNGVSFSKSINPINSKEIESRTQTDRFHKISHELRTTTHAIYGFLEMIELDDKFDKLDDNIKDYVKRAERNADVLCRIVCDVLSFVKELYNQEKTQANGSIAKNMSFVICSQCFWSASVIDFPNNQIKRCINCKGRRVLNFPMGIADRIDLL
jgi:hypothetical protein